MPRAAPAARPDAPGLQVGGKTGSAEKVIGGAEAYERERAGLLLRLAVFPTDGRLELRRYLVLILYDEPKGTQRRDLRLPHRRLDGRARPPAG